MMVKKKGEMEEDSKSGKYLFISVLVLVLVYFWWLLLYSHGVKAVH
jgi:hypothetical protein